MKKTTYVIIGMIVTAFILYTILLLSSFKPISDTSQQPRIIINSIGIITTDSIQP